MMHVRGHVHCYSDASWLLFDEEMVLRESDHGIGAIAPPALAPEMRRLSSLEWQSVS